MVYGITDLATFVWGTIFIVLLPGPNSLYVMSVASRHGLGAGYRGALGIFTGDAILMALAAAGVASLLQAHPMIFMALKYLGAAYLSYLGWGLLRQAVVRWHQGMPAETVPAPAPSWARAPFKVALLISLTNPKSILFFVSFFIQFVSPTYPRPALSFLILGAIVQVCSLVYLSVLMFSGSYLAAMFRQRHHVAAVCTGGVGGLFIAFGIRLASAGLS